MKWLKRLFGGKNEAKQAAGEQPKKEPSKTWLFMAAGKGYTNVNQLVAVKKERDYLYEDIYGREWMYVRERYPCFDSYDFLNEDRYYHWYVLPDGEDLWLVYVDDGKIGLEVTKNPEKLNYTPREVLKELGWIQDC